MDLHQYMNWLHSLRMGFYNLFSRELGTLGDDVFELYFQDNIQFNKIIKAYNLKYYFLNLFTPSGFNWWRENSIGDIKIGLFSRKKRFELRRKIQLRIFIEKLSPDIIFLREPCQIDNDFWKPYKGKIKIITMIGCDISHPINWRLHNSDVLFTITDEFNRFFNLNGVPSHLIEYGVDTKLLDELLVGPKKYNVTFVGLLGSKEQARKTAFLEYISNKCEFKWWGPKGDLIDDYPGLQKSWQGIVAGKEMYQVYLDSKIVLNDYVQTNGDAAVNLRLKEVIGVGTFLLTREAVNLSGYEKQGLLRTFSDNEDCIRKIEYYLTNEKEREDIAKNGKAYVCEKFDYSDIISEIRNKF